MQYSDLISVIVPIFNTEDFLPKTIHSILNSTYTNLEVILIDDGSTDSSGKICDDYLKMDSRVKVDHIKNGGVSNARNRGLSFAKGKYITFVDSDDELMPNSILYLYDALVKENADLSIGRLATEIGLFKEHKKDQVDKLSIKTASDLPALLLDNLNDSSCGKLFSNSLIGDLRFDPNHNINEDGYFVFQYLLRCKKVVYLSQEVYKYSFRLSSATNQAFSAKFNDILYYAGKKASVLQDYESQFPGLAEAILLKHHLAYLNIMASRNSGYSQEELYLARENVLKYKKLYKTLHVKDLIRIILIKYFFGVYLKIMRRTK